MKKTNISRRELNKIKCRERILKASRRLFSSKGYENTFLEDVAEKAEISKATLYNYFPNKEALLIGIAEDELSQVNAMIKNELSKVENADEKIRRVLEVFIMDSIQYLNLSRKITYLNSCEDSSLYNTRVEMLVIFRNLVLEAQQQKIYRSDIEVSDIVDILMGIYFLSQFEWTNSSNFEMGYCKEKFNRIYSIALSGVYL